MSVELRPLGVACNIRCRYCYQNPQRNASGVSREYDMALMQAAIERENKPFILFGGEPLLIPEADLEQIWTWGWDRFGQNGVQTNGSLINEAHVKMFRDYRVRVGISIDGPGELNDVRWAGSLEATRRATAKTEAAIRRLCSENILPSLIVTLHRGNAAKDKLPILMNWLQEFDALGIKSARLHILEVDDEDVRKKYALSDDENIEVFLKMAEFEKKLRVMRFDLFSEIKNLLIGNDKKTSCVWHSCDPYTTAAVSGIEGRGQRSNCGRTNKDGVDFVKTETPGFERYLALSCTPQGNGGCMDCSYFVMCKGQCPGTAIGGDWRNRSEHCLVWKALFKHFEDEFLLANNPQMLTSAERILLEKRFIERWINNENPAIHSLLSTLRDDESE